MEGSLCDSNVTVILNKLQMLLVFQSCDAKQANRSTAVQQKKYLLKAMRNRGVAAVHLSVSGAWETDCDRRCLAQVSPSLLSVPSHLKTDWLWDCLIGTSAGLPVGRSDGRGRTGCSAVTSLRDASVPATCSPVREVVAKEGYTSTGDTKASVPGALLDVEEDRQEWWANDVLTNCVAEEVRHSRIRGPRCKEEQEEKKKMRMRSGMRSGCSDLHF